MMKLLLLMSIIFAIPFAGSAYAEQGSIPNWVKELAVLWGNNEITDGEFLTAIQYLIDVGILSLPDVPQITYHTSVHPDAVVGIIDRIIDGDTLVFNGETYRLSLIDAPEKDEDGGSSATEAISMLCPVGSTAYMELDSIVDKDKYGRYLGVVWCEGNNYSTTAGEYLYNNGFLQKFYTEFCSTMEAATDEWAEETNNYFYHSICG